MARAHILVPLLLLLSLAARPGALTAQDESPKLRVLSVTGQGDVHSAPDLARVRLGVMTEAKNARDASQENARKMADVVAALKKAGIPEAKIQTVQLTIDPAYDYDQPAGRQVLRGFQARNVVEASTTELAKLGPILDAVIGVGGNTVEGIGFELQDMGAAQVRALAAAVDDARRKAEALAGAAGVRLGEVQEISAMYGGGPIPYLARASMATMEARAEPAPPPPVSPGELTVSSTVQVVYRLE